MKIILFVVDAYQLYYLDGKFVNNKTIEWNDRDSDGRKPRTTPDDYKDTSFKFAYDPRFECLALFINISAKNETPPSNAPDSADGDDNYDFGPDYDFGPEVTFFDDNRTLYYIESLFVTNPCDLKEYGENANFGCIRRINGEKKCFSV